MLSRSFSENYIYGKVDIKANAKDSMSGGGSDTVGIYRIGYEIRDEDGTNIEPWNWTYSNITDLQEQADCYNAAFQTFWNKPWLAGIYRWMYCTCTDELSIQAMTLTAVCCEV